MQLNGTHCCGIQEISGLATHTTGEDALKAFCLLVFGSGRRSPFDSKCVDIGLKTYLYSFYMFTAAIYTKKDANSYGHKFADFLKTHKLGQVTTTRAQTNHSFHRDHQVKAWLWRPNFRNLKGWWADQQGL